MLNWKHSFERLSKHKYVAHIKQNSVDIEGNFLKLVGNEKNFYFDYFGRKDIIEKMVE